MILTRCYHSFVDRDMVMRHFGHGVGHLQYDKMAEPGSDDNDDVDAGLGSDLEDDGMGDSNMDGDDGGSETDSDDCQLVCDSDSDCDEDGYGSF